MQFFVLLGEKELQISKNSGVNTLNISLLVLISLQNHQCEQWDCIESLEEDIVFEELSDLEQAMYALLGVILRAWKACMIVRDNSATPYI